MRFSQIKKCSDEELMRLLQHGHHDTLAVLFDRHHRLVLNIALKILGDHGEAEDLMQDVFFEIYRKAGQFDPTRGTLKTWLVQYAYHRSLNRREYLGLRSFYDRKHDADFLELQQASWNDWRGLTSAECTHLVREVLRTLNAKQRQTLELVCFQGLSLGEIAGRMKESLSNVRHHYYRGLKKLRSLIARPQPEQPAVPLGSEVIDVRR